MAKFRKKLIEIEAVQFVDTQSAGEILGWTNFQVALDARVNGAGKLIPVIEIPTLDGTMIANVGDWIIRGVKGELYTCKPDIFAATYEEVQP